ncbi:unnamed protein product [Cochlearia groenlandica]
MIKWKPIIHLIFGQVPSKDKDHHLTKVTSKDKVTIHHFSAKYQEEQAESIHLIFGQVPSKDKDHHLTKVPSKDKVTILRLKHLPRRQTNSLSAKSLQRRRPNHLIIIFWSRPSKSKISIQPPTNPAKPLQEARPSSSSTLGSAKYMAKTKPSHSCPRKRPMNQHDQSALRTIGQSNYQVQGLILLLGLCIYQEISQNTPTNPYSNRTKKKARLQEEAKAQT